MEHSKRFYAIKRGRMNGIFDGWKQCEPYVNGFKEALFEGFDTRDEACRYLEISQPTHQELAKWEVKQTLYFSRKRTTTNAYVDGSYSQDVYGGAFIVIQNGEIVYERSKRGTNKGAAKEIGASAGELHAAMLAIQYALKHGSRRLLLYHDNQLIRDLVQKKRKVTCLFEQHYVDFVEECKKKGNLLIDFIKVKAHNGGRNKWNDYVDKLAVNARKSNREVHRNVAHIRKQTKELEKLLPKLSKAHKRTLALVQSKLKNKNILTELEEEAFKDCYTYYKGEGKVKPLEGEMSVFPDIAPKNWREMLVFFEKGYSFKQIQDHYRLEKTALLQHLVKAKLQHSSMSIDKLLPRYRKPAKNTDKVLLKALITNQAWSKLVKMCGGSENSLLTKLCYLYMTRQIESVDHIWKRRRVLEVEETVAVSQVSVTKDVKATHLTSAPKEKEKENANSDNLLRRCLNYLKNHRIFMNRKEREQANNVYLTIKSTRSLTKKQRDYLFSLAKQLKKRKDVLALLDVPTFSKSYYLIKMGLDVEEVARLREFSSHKVIDDLLKAYMHGQDVDLRCFLTHPNAYDMILAKLQKHGATKKVLEMNMPSFVSYEDVKIVAVVNGYPYQS